MALGRKILNDYMLIDLRFIGPPFTWIKKKDGKLLLRKDQTRLLHQMNGQNYSQMLTKKYSCSQLGSHPNHFNLERKRIIKNKPFRFVWMWTTHRDCKELIEKEWKMGNAISQEANITKKLENITPVLRAWNKSSFRNIQDQIQISKEKLKDVYSQRQCIM